MSPSAQLTSEQLKVILEDENITDKGAREVQQQVEESDEVFHAANFSSVWNTVLSTINNKFDHECLDEAVRLLKVHSICESTDDSVPGHKYSIPGLPGTDLLVHRFMGIWFVLRRWVWDADMPGPLMANEMGLRKTVTSVAAAMICKLVTETVVMGLPLSILWGNTLEKWVIVAHNRLPGVICEERESYSLHRLNSVPCHLMEIQTTPPHGHPALVSALQPIVVVTMARVAETVKNVINEMIRGTDLKQVNLLHADNARLTHDNLNTSFEQAEIR